MRKLRVVVRKVRAFLPFVASAVCIGVGAFFYGTQATENFDDLVVGVYQRLDVMIGEVEYGFETVKRCVGGKALWSSLRAENAALKKQALKATLLEKENADLRKLVNYLDSLQLHYISARVVGVTRDNALGLRFMINVGAAAGILEGQAVLNESGLVGRVVRVSDRSARILPITNVSSRVPVFLLQSKVRCIAAGLNSGDKLKLLYLPENATPVPGETVVTSGEEGILPFGIVVGVVTLDSLEKDREFGLRVSHIPAQVGIVSVVSAK